VSVVVATINQERRVAAAVIQEICCDLNAIAPRGAKLPHPIIIPPTVSQILYTDSEMVSAKVDDRAEIVDKAPTG